MQKKWLILTIIVLIYLPVTIDATVMHVATPSLSAALNLTANQLLWVIDIYTDYGGFDFTDGCTR